MNTVISISTRRRCGVARVRRAGGVARAGGYRRRGAADAPPEPRRRPGPQGSMSDAALVEAIRRALADSPFPGEGYRKVWARLRHAGLRTSRERVRRLRRENGLAPAARAATTARSSRRPSTRYGEPTGPRPSPARRARWRRSSPSTAARRHASASMPPSAAPATRRSSRSARASPNTSAGSGRTPPRVSPSATTTAAAQVP